MPDIKSEKGRDEYLPSAPPAPSPDMELAEISKEEFQARKKRRIEEKRSEAADMFTASISEATNMFTSSLFIPDIKEEEGRDMDDPPAPAPEPNMFTPYFFNDESLGQDSDANEHIEYWRDDLSPKQRLRFVLKKLLECHVNHTLVITAEHKTILRPLLLKDYWVKGKLVPSNLRWDRQEHYTGLAHHLFTPKENDEKTCTKCTTTSRDNYGPFAECVAGGRAVLKGACFNCYYKGEGTCCSLRIAFDKAEKAEEKGRHPRGNRLSISAKTIRNTSTKDLEKAFRSIRDELRSREEDD